MNHSKGSCDDAMSSDMLCSSDFGGVYDESFERVLRRCDVVKHAMLFRFCGVTMNHSKGSCGDAMSSDMLCAQEFRGVYDESFERVLRRCDVVRHAMLFRFVGGLR